MSKFARVDDIDFQPENLDAFWMPYTANRQFKAAPRLLVGAEGMYYTTADQRQVLDAGSGLWCVNAGHGRTKIVEAVREQVGRLDYAPSFQVGHPAPFELAARLAAMMPGALNRVFFTNSGSEAVDTALKIALAYHRVRGEGTRVRLIGRERSYHGVGFGGTSVGGIAANRAPFGPLLPFVDHIRHTHDPEHNAYSRGQPEYGDHFADDLERLVDLHGASTIAAVIVEPVAGSTGVLVPPKGYLERLREICNRHGILLIFDEVITGFGRLGASFACVQFGIEPDLVTLAKGMTNGTVPMGAVIAANCIYEACVAAAAENSIELFHGYTYSAHPLATAAALAALDIYEQEGLFERAAELAPYLEDGVHSLKGLPHVVDLRNLGLVGGIELEPREGKPTARAFEVVLKCYEKGLLIRSTGDTVTVSPPLIAERNHIDQIVHTLGDVLRTVD